MLWIIFNLAHLIFRQKNLYQATIMDVVCELFCLFSKIILLFGALFLEGGVRIPTEQARRKFHRTPQFAAIDGRQKGGVRQNFRRACSVGIPVGFVGARRPRTCEEMNPDGSHSVILSIENAIFRRKTALFPSEIPSLISSV